MDETDISSLVVEFDCAASNDDEISVNDTSFSAVSLHDRTRRSWAVIGDVSGAIASGGDGKLLMRMREEDARKAAVRLTETACKAPTRH